MPDIMSNIISGILVSGKAGKPIEQAFRLGRAEMKMAQGSRSDPLAPVLLGGEAAKSPVSAALAVSRGIDQPVGGRDDDEVRR